MNTENAVSNLKDHMFALADVKQKLCIASKLLHHAEIEYAVEKKNTDAFHEYLCIVQHGIREADALIDEILAMGLSGDNARGE